MAGRRLSFWVAVGGVAILSNFLLELAAAKLPIPGLREFTNFVHCGPGRTAA
jgi:hypothetical protein